MASGMGAEVWSPPLAVTPVRPHSFRSYRQLARSVSGSIYAPPNGERCAQPAASRWWSPTRRFAKSATSSAASSEALLDADSFEDLPGKWQAAIMKAEENALNLRIVGSD